MARTRRLEATAGECGRNGLAVHGLPRPAAQPRSALERLRSILELSGDAAAEEVLAEAADWLEHLKEEGRMFAFGDVKSYRESRQEPAVG